MEDTQVKPTVLQASADKTRDPHLINLVGRTIQAMPLMLYAHGSQEPPQQYGWYWDNDLTNQELAKWASFAVDTNNPDVKPDRCYVVVPELINAYDKGWKVAGEFNQELGNHAVLAVVDANKIVRPALHDLLIYAVEAGVTNPHMLRAFTYRVILWHGLENMVFTHPSPEQWHVEISGMHLFILPDGSVHS